MSDRQPVSGSFRLPYLSIALQYTYVHMTLIFNNEMISNNEIISEIDEVLLYFSGRKTWVFNTLELQLYYPNVLNKRHDAIKDTITT